MKIKVDRDLCIGAGTCVVVAPKTFDLDDELKAVVKIPKRSSESNEERSHELVEWGDDKDTIIEAAKVCPVFAIILEEDGKQIYP